MLYDYVLVTKKESDNLTVSIDALVGKSEDS